MILKYYIRELSNKNYHNTEQNVGIPALRIVISLHSANVRSSGFK
jgi:hypothetical protein